MEPGRTIKSKSEAILSVGQLKGAFSKFRQATGERYRSSRAQIAYYVPGIFLLSMGFSLIFAQSLFIALLSGLLLYVGAMTIILGRRLMTAHTKFKEVVRQVEARIYVRGHPNQGPVQWEEQDNSASAGPDKKTVLH